MVYDPERITFFAETDARGKRVPFGIKAKDRQRHMYVIGKTGMGKSTMLENMAVQDIKNGEGMAFIDPHGSSAETLLNYIPEERIDDVVYFAPFDMAHPIAFNVMEDVGPEKRHLVVSGLMSTFKKIWVDAWSARMEYILTNTLLALLEYPDSTLLSVNRMLADKNYRQKVVDNITDPAVRSFWTEEFAGYTDRFAAEALPAIQNKVGQFTGNPLIRNVIGQTKSSFDIRELMDNRKILIMNLSKGLIGESNANLLGSMLTTRIYLAAMSRADLPTEKMKLMPNFYFYVDEFQSFANATFADILSEARKYHLNLIIAHQYIEQMEEEVKNAVFGNVGTTITFRVGPFDAEVLETIYAPTFTATDIVNLSARQIYLTLMIDGIGSPPFSATTLPPVPLPQTSYRNMVIMASRKHFTHGRADVEKAIDELHTPTPAPEKKQQQKNNFIEGRQTGGNNNASRNNNGGPHRGNTPDRHSGNGSRKNHEQRRAEEQKPERKKQEKQHNLDDLRSVLRTMTGGNDIEKKEKTIEQKQKKPSKQEPSPNNSHNDLKAALSVLMKEQSEKNAPAERAQPTENKENETKDTRKAASTSDIPHNTKKTEPAQETVTHDQSSAKNENELSPKELERMMRITTSDKTPFR